MENEQLDIPEEIVVKKNGATFVFRRFFFGLSESVNV